MSTNHYNKLLNEKSKKWSNVYKQDHLFRFTHIQTIKNTIPIGYQID